MKKQGAIILGIGGDNSNSSPGTFFEGVMTTGYPTDATDNAVQANIVSAGYANATLAGSPFTAGARDLAAGPPRRAAPGTTLPATPAATTLGSRA